MNFKKGFNYLTNFNFKKGFLRLALLATPIWIIGLWIYDNDFPQRWNSYQRKRVWNTEMIVFVVLVNPITAYIFMRWIVIPPIKWVLEGFSNND